MSNKVTWIGWKEAVALSGLELPTLTQYANQKKIPVRISRITPQAKPAFVKEDIEALLNNNIKP